MQTLATKDTFAPIGAGLYEQADDLEALHRQWTRQVAAWQSSHEVAVDNATSMLRRIDTLIAAIERL